MTIALTGGSGLIGATVLQRLKMKYQVCTIGRRSTSDMVADFADPASISELDLNGYDTVVHCAGIVDEDFGNPERAFRQAILGMDAFVKCAKAAGVRRFVYISSAHIYGRFTGTIDETSRPNPLHDYAIAHFASEQILRRAVGGEFRGAVLRPCAVFGIPPDLASFRRWSLIPFDFPRAAILNGEIKLASSGIQRRNFVGSEDIAKVIELWLEQDGDSFSEINPIGSQEMTVFEFAQLCAHQAEKLNGRACRIVRPEGTDMRPDSFHYTTTNSCYLGKTDLSLTLGIFMKLLLENAETSCKEAKL